MFYFLSQLSGDKVIKLDDLEGKAVLAVNVAST